MVDLLTNQKLIWKLGSVGDDGRVFESKPLDQSDEPELLQEAHEARTALIEQVDVLKFKALRINKILGCSRFIFNLYSRSQSQVADLDDEFAEMLLTDFCDNFDTVPSVKVSNV